MKKLIVGLTMLASLSAFASPMSSFALKGNYELNRVVEDDNTHKGCPNFLTVKVNKSGVSLLDTNDGSPLERFYASREGTKYTEGDIGPWRIKNLNFNKRSVKYSDTSPVTIVGFVRTTNYAKLNRKNQLVVGEEATLVPAGILGIDYDYKCIYDRIIED